MKSYPTRDSATALLRKIGVKRAAYPRFLTISGPEGAERFDVDDAAARASVQSPQVPRNPTLDAIAQAGCRLADAPVSVEVRGGRVIRRTKAPKTTLNKEPNAPARRRAAGKTASAPPVPKAALPGKGPLTVGAKTRELILAGKTNAEVWAALQPLYGLDEGKRYYPGWYRVALRRRGLLPRPA